MLEKSCAGGHGRKRRIVQKREGNSEADGAPWVGGGNDRATEAYSWLMMALRPVESM